MNVILTRDIPNVGKKNSLYSGTDGFCRNFLLKQGIAVHATPKNRRILDARQKKIELKKQKLQTTVDLLAKGLKQNSIIFLLNTNERMKKTTKAITHTEIKRHILALIAENSNEEFAKIDFKFDQKIYHKPQKSTITLGFAFSIKINIDIEIQ